MTAACSAAQPGRRVRRSVPVGLIPVAYGSLVLFRPARPRIEFGVADGVNQEDRRIANGLEIRLKLKVKGEHLTPMLHANIDATPAIGFTFEDPTSADVIVGDGADGHTRSGAVRRRAGGRARAAARS